MRVTLETGGGCHEAGVDDFAAATLVDVRRALDLCSRPGRGGSA